MKRNATMIGLLALMSTPALADDTYGVDIDHSAVIFKAKHFNVGYTFGNFRKVDGTYSVENGAPTSFNFTIPIDSLDSANEKRDQHLKSPDFFDAANHPNITFTSTKVKKSSDTVYDVTGDLTMHGVTKPITIPVEVTGEGDDPWGNHRTGMLATFTVNRGDFGINWGIEDGAISADVEMIVSLEGIRK
ncbi:MAG: YceI family protein [Myxococcota bacterium]